MSPRARVSTIWLAGASRVLDLELGPLSAEERASLRGRVRREAATAEDLLNVVDGPRGAARSDAVALLVDRLGDDALDVDCIGADFIAQAVVAALRDLGVDKDESKRVAERCRAAVLDAGADFHIGSPSRVTAGGIRP